MLFVVPIFRIPRWGLIRILRIFVFEVLSNIFSNIKGVQNSMIPRIPLEVPGISLSLFFFSILIA